MKQAGVKKFKKFKLGDKYYDDYDLAEMCKMHSKFMKNRVEKGHTKGVVLGDKFTALWLVHSVPRFPPIPDSKYTKFIMEQQRKKIDMLFDGVFSTILM